MRLEGIHHITAITGDAPRNLDFYTRVLGLRLAAKTVNRDDPSVYHLFYADERGRPGSELTFFEYPGAAPGRPGAGMVHRIVWRVGSTEATRGAGRRGARTATREGCAWSRRPSCASPAGVVQSYERLPTAPSRAGGDRAGLRDARQLRRLGRRRRGPVPPRGDLRTPGGGLRARGLRGAAADRGVRGRSG